MSMQRFVCIVFLSLPTFNGYCQLADNQVILGKAVKVEHSEIDKQYTRFTPTLEDVQLADSVSRMHIKKNRDKYPWTDEIVNYDSYYRQYVGYLNLNNDKTIFINNFCSSDPAWKHRLISVLGGGSCYFNLKVDLHSRKAFNLNVNAPE